MEIFHKGLPRTFLGVSCKKEEADVIVLSAPYDSTTSYGCGARAGPAAIIDASRQLELYDLELGEITKKVKIYTEDELEVDRGNPKRNCQFVQEAVGAVLDAGKFPVLFGGEHSVSIGAFWAIEERFDKKEISVLQIDAHADMREEYEGSRYSHACAMARCREKLHAVSVGIRSYSEEEANEVKKLDIFGVEFDKNEVIERLRDKVYVTIDLDGFDPSEVPAVGTPEPGGLRYLQVLSLLRTVASKRKIVGFDVVELAPIPGSLVSEFFAAKLTYKLIGYAHMK
ncbi:MAG: agmatinase [Candidatus Micrarchaeota archaeon]|nr:agmatinase [Candidatus Micrarchaeota archaeon]